MSSYTPPQATCRALVRADAADKQVRIHVDGPADARRDLLAIIRYNFEVIHADYGCQPKGFGLSTPEIPGAHTPGKALDALRSAGGKHLPPSCSPRRYGHQAPHRRVASEAVDTHGGN